MTIKTHMELMTHDDNHIFVNPLYPATYKIHCTKHIVYPTLKLFLALAFYKYAYLLIVLYISPLLSPSLKIALNHVC